MGVSTITLGAVLFGVSEISRWTSQSKLISRALCRNAFDISYSVSSRPVRGVVFVGSGPSGHAKIWTTVVAVGVPFVRGTCFSAWRKSRLVDAVGLQWQMSLPPHETVVAAAAIPIRNRKDKTRVSNVHTLLLRTQ